MIKKKKGGKRRGGTCGKFHDPKASPAPPYPTAGGKKNRCVYFNGKAQQ